jgi:hypothetical protein
VGVEKQEEAVGFPELPVPYKALGLEVYREATEKDPVKEGDIVMHLGRVGGRWTDPEEGMPGAHSNGYVRTYVVRSAVKAKEVAVGMTVHIICGEVERLVGIQRRSGLWVYLTCGADAVAGYVADGLAEEMRPELAKVLKGMGVKG